MENCAPVAWKEFFQLPGVQTDIRELAPLMLKDGKMFHIEPPMPLMFRALEMVSPDEIRVVILGQDPTPQAGQATGLAFSVADPMSVGTVLNVLLEVALEGWNVNIFNDDLTNWAKQGVLLLNTALTVQQGKAGSHIKLNWWGKFSELLIEYISGRAGPSSGYSGEEKPNITRDLLTTKSTISLWEVTPQPWVELAPMHFLAAATLNAPISS